VRERREAMWQVAREIVRLGEVVERQQILLGSIAERVGAVDVTKAGNGSASDSDGEHIPVAEAAPIDSAVEAELATLRGQLDRERELVERLRRSKVHMERRAAEAEALLADTETAQAGARRQSILRRLLRRDSDT
jgi:hypothetical protein